MTDQAKNLPATAPQHPQPGNGDRPLVRRGGSLMIKGLMPGLAERGRIKIGEKGAMKTSDRGNEFQPPKKLDHFKITTMRRGQDGNFERDDAAHQKFGDKPVSLPVMLLFDDIELNFQSRYAAFKGKTLFCAGDGEVAQRLKDGEAGKRGERDTIACPCHRADPAYEGNDRCKINGSLSMILQGVGGVGGVWKLRTTSYNSVVSIMSALAMIKRITGGPLAGIPLNLVLAPKTVTAPNNGAVQTVHIVSLEYAGDMAQLQQAGLQIATQNATHRVAMAHVEEEAKRLLAPPAVAVFDDDDDDVVDEFYPEQGQQGGGQGEGSDAKPGAETGQRPALQAAGETARKPRGGGKKQQQAQADAAGQAAQQSGQEAAAHHLKADEDLSNIPDFLRRTPGDTKPAAEKPADPPAQTQPPEDLF